MHSLLKASIKRKCAEGRSKDTVRESRNTIRTAKAHLELNLLRDVKSNKKGIYK